MSKKYELLTDNTVTAFGETLFRIRALRDIPNIGVSMSDLGGYIASEKNLSHTGDAWVQDDAQVAGKARVYGDALVRDKAWMYGNAQVYDDALVCGNARVYDNAWVFGDALVCGNAWVFGDARVSGDAWVRGNAWVSGNARVFGDARVSGDAWIASPRHIMSISLIGSEDGALTLFQTKGAPCVTRGCFSGTLDDFEAAVKETHGDNKHGQEYRAAIALARLRAREWEAA